ncbi:uncharacterized protein LOC107269031 [Cephus cinctus]|uniref:Uncharacterized protein LOC107269031 n=1 Tax=Cephus cinctus TaxID=211228 RepID=A0AAJ7RJI4_CEPCN|nr:uncharacterized protein LOC107269031 [Cephus cinctus]
MEEKEKKSTEIDAENNDVEGEKSEGKGELTQARKNLTARHDFGKLWHRFRVLNSQNAILHGTLAMNSMRFKHRSRGFQGASCSVVAIVFGRLLEPKDWTKHYIDQVLEYGDKVFRISQTRNRVNPGVYMTTNLVYPEFYVADYKVTICTEESSVYGNLFSETVGCPNFMDGLERFFKLNDSGVVTAQGTSVAMWRQLGAGFFHFDPAGCAEDGSKSANGVACLMRFKYMNEMADLYLSKLDKKYDSRYCIDKVSVLRVMPVNRNIFLTVSESPNDALVVDRKILRSINPADVEEGKRDCTRSAPKETKVQAPLLNTNILKEPLSITISNYSIDAQFAIVPLVDQNSFDTGYDYYDMEANVPSTFKELSGDMAILHGWTHEGSEMYKGKGAQNVANCVMAIGMKKVHAVKAWLRPRLDEILVLGDAIYADVKNEKPTIKTMTAADLNDTKFQIQGKKMIVDVDLLTVVGTVTSKMPEVLSLKDALDEFFLVNTDGVIECTSMALAVWSQDDYYYVFDPRQCDLHGNHIIEEKGKASGRSAKDSTVREKKVKGKCCVIRFPNIDSLVTLFLKNVDPAKKNDRFTIRHVTVVNDVPGTRPWNDFGPIQNGKWILRGKIANNDDSFEDESRGVQGLAMPVAGLVHAKDLPPAKWTRDTIDDAIRDGDAYFNWCISPEEEKDRTLFVRNMKKVLYSKNRRVNLEAEEASVVGDLKASADGDQLDLTKAINQFFQSRQFGVVQVKDLSVAIWKAEEELKDKTKEIAYYCFDSNPRGPSGEKNMQAVEDELVGCVIRTLDTSELAKFIEGNIDPNAEPGNDFVIHDIKIQSIGQPMTDEEIEKEKEIPIKPELNLYTALGDDGACLNGSFNQANELNFKHHSRDKQQAANALVALAMTKLYNPHLWYREVVDDILKVGDKVTVDNSENLPEAEEDEESPRNYLLPSELNEEFVIGVNKMSVTLEEDAVTGKLSELSKNIEDFFGENEQAVFRYQNIMLPIWKEGSVFFTMDPRGRDSRGVPKEKDGVATVMWFTNTTSLANSLQMALDKTDGEFSLDSVDIENAYETRVAEGDRIGKTISSENLWHHFSKMSDGVWSFNGNVTMSDEKFEEVNRNKQSAAIAVIGVIFSKVYQPRSWKPQVLDEVIVTGDKLHSKCVERLGEGSIPKVNEIITEFFLSNRRIDLTIKDCVESGDLAGKGSKLQDLKSGLDQFFTNYNTGVLTAAGTNMAIWKIKDFYYALIPGSSGNGDASMGPQVLRFSSTDFMASILKTLLGGTGDYEITAIDVIDWNKLPPWKFDPSSAIRPSNLPPLNAYKRLRGAARAILRGTAHQASEIFPEVFRNRQTAANCVVALGMSVIKNPTTWTKLTLDEILLVGSNVHKESMTAKPAREKLTPDDIIRVFYVGVTVLTADVKAAVSGQVAIPPPEPEVKGKKGAKKKKPARKEKKGKKGKTKREPPPPPPIIFLEEGLQKFFENNRAGILVTGRYMTAIWKDFGVYFMYDPRARNDQGLDDDFGASCIMWFACMQPFYDLIFANIEEREKYGRYDIYQVTIKTTLIEPLPCPASFRTIQEKTAPSIPLSSTKKVNVLDVATLSGYNIVDDEISVLRGNVHLGDNIFNIKSRGLQSTAIAAVAIVVGLLHVPSTWTSDLVDAILKYGDLLHVDSTRMYLPGARNLSPRELLTVFIVGDLRAHIHIHHHTNAGVLHLYDLISNLTLFFKNNCSGILHMTNMAVAVMQHYGKFYLFDPCARNEFGRPSEDGAACVIKCENISKMARVFIENCNYKRPTVYTLNAVNVLNLRFFSDAKKPCPPSCIK